MTEYEALARFEHLINWIPLAGKRAYFREALTVLKEWVDKANAAKKEAPRERPVRR